MSSSLKLQKLLIQKLSEKYSLNLRDLKRAFSNFDKDQNGLLDLSEVEKGIQQYLTGVSIEAISELVALYDVNGDGSISYDEFLSILRNPKEIGEREQLALTPRYDNDDMEDDFDLYTEDNEVPPLPAVDYEYYNDRRQRPLRQSSEFDEFRRVPESRQDSRGGRGNRSGAAPRPPRVPSRAASVMSWGTADESIPESAIDDSNSHDLEVRARAYLHNLKTLFFHQAKVLRQQSKVGSLRERMTLSSTELMDGVARGCLDKAFQPYTGKTDGRTRATKSLVDLGDFAKVLRSFSLPGGKQIRPEIIYFLFNLCINDDYEQEQTGRAVADADLFASLLFGDAPKSPKKKSTQQVPAAGSPSRVAGVSTSGSKASLGMTSGEGVFEALHGLSLVDYAEEGKEEVAKGPLKKGSAKEKDLPAVPLRFVSSKTRAAMAVPSSFDATLQSRSAEAPNCELAPVHCFGMACNLHSNNVLYSLSSEHCANPNGHRADPDFLDPSVIVYPSAAMGVIHDLSNNNQLFFNEHDHEITTMSMSHCGSYVATGSCGAHKSCIYVWESTPSEDYSDANGNPLSLCKLGEGFFDRAICSVSFCCDPHYVAGIGCDDGHKIGIWDIRNPDTYLISSNCQNGIPPQIRGMKWAPQQQYTEYISSTQRGLCDVMCTVGEHHIRLWSFKRPVESSIGTQEKACLVNRGLIFGALQKQVQPPKTYTCLDFAPCADGISDVLAGGSNGVVYLFRKTQCIAFQNAIRGGVKCLQVSGDSVYVGGANDIVKILNVRSLSVLQSFRVSSLETDINTNVQVCVSSARAVSASKRPGSSGMKSARKGSASGPAVGPTSDEVGTIIGITVVKTMSRGSHIIAASSSGKAVKIAVDRSGSSSSNKEESSNGISSGVSPLFYYHTGELWGLSTGMVKSSTALKQAYIATVGDDRRLCIWNPERKTLVARTMMDSPARSVHFDRNCRFLAVGSMVGSVHIFTVTPHGRGIDMNRKGSAMSASARNRRDLQQEARSKQFYGLEEVAFRKDFKESVSSVKFCPNSQMLAAGSNDDTICLYRCELPDTMSSIPSPSYEDASSCKLTPMYRLKGHSSYITHLDWSLDGKLLRSTCGAYELLYWDASTGIQYTYSPADMVWKTENVPLGFPVMGIWPPYSDGTDINAVDVSPSQFPTDKIVVTGDDNGMVNIMNYPCVVKHAPRHIYRGHGAHVTNVRFYRQTDMHHEGEVETENVASIGGRDRAMILWAVIPMVSPSGPPKKQGMARYKEQLF